LPTEYFSETAKRRPGTTAHCRTGRGDVLVDNGTFGKILHAVVLDDDGTPLYDLPVHWDRGGGGVTVPITANGEICFVEHLRPVPTSPTARGTEEPPPNLDSLGVRSLELPRGFADDGEEWATTALREATEELALTMSGAIRIGSINPNTSTTIHSAGVFAARAGAPVNGIPWADNTTRAERILDVRAMSEEDIWRAIGTQEIFCGFTLAALMLYFAWPRRDEFRMSRS
jgi:hypothetical protein